MRDFPPDALKPYGIEAQHPHDFVLNLPDLAPGVVAGAVRNHLESLKNPPKTVHEYPAILETQGWTQTVSILRELML